MTGSQHRPAVAIETALTLRFVFNLPLRQAEGFLRSIISMMGVDLEAPDDRLSLVAAGASMSG